MGSGPASSRPRTMSPLTSARFLIFGTQRSGSNLLVETLRQHPTDVRCLFEPLNRDQFPAWLGARLNVSGHADAMRDLPAFMARFWREWCPPRGACGFKVFPDHLRPPATLAQLFDAGGALPPSPVRSLLLLRADVRAQHAALVRAMSNGSWGFGADAAVRQQVCAPSDADCQRRMEAVFRWAPGAAQAGSLAKLVGARNAWHAAVRRAAAQAGSAVLELQTESLWTSGASFNATMGRVAAFLSLAPFAFAPPRLRTSLRTVQALRPPVARRRHGRPHPPTVSRRPRRRPSNATTWRLTPPR
mmetsp:Transcript_7929/g.25323  ORF Transcript_7929/g.25323 Transcript_7929/m.25323 type:complete len:302 (+) Transcript_7929:27-932(+)